MESNKPTLEKASKAALVAMFGLFILGMIFYKERALFADSAFRLFYVINDSKIIIPCDRYGAAVVQILPYIAFRLHLPINYILFCYSTSYNLFYLTIMSIMVYRLRQYALAILMAFFYFLFVSESYIWANEIFPGTAWMFLGISVLLYPGNRNHLFVQLLLFAAFIFLALFSHFIVIIPTVFLLAYSVIDNKGRRFSQAAIVALWAIPAAIIGIRFLDTQPNSYDSMQLHGITHFSLRDILHTFRQQVVITFLGRCLTNYWLAIPVFAAGLAAMIKTKRFMLLACSVAFVLAYIVIMALTYGDLDKNTLLFHIESEWACIGIIVAAPFVFYFLPGLKPSAAVAVVSVIFLVRLAYIVAYLPAFTERNRMNENILAQMRKKNISKLALYNDARLMSAAKLYWALPFESIMLSSVDGDKPQLTFFFVNKDDTGAIEKIKYPNGFFDGYGILPAGMLNKDYFMIDTVHPYQVMTYEELCR